MGEAVPRQLKVKQKLKMLEVKADERENTGQGRESQRGFLWRKRPENKYIHSFI